jgi:hypothetical protein
MDLQLDQGIIDQYLRSVPNMYIEKFEQPLLLLILHICKSRKIFPEIPNIISIYTANEKICSTV